MYNKDQIIKYLSEQKDIKSAIKNINNLDGNYNSKVVDNDNQTILFYFDKTNKKKQDIKDLIIKHMEDNGWEKSGYEDIMSLEELKERLNLKIVSDV